MKAIILAAGEGARLRPLTNDKPKCMVEYKGKAIISYILEVMNNSTIDEVAVINGYKKKVLEDFLEEQEVSFYSNNKFDTTNMVATLFSAIEFMDDDIIISYADIIYEQAVLDKLIQDNNDFSVVIDKDWKKLWQLRMDNPLNDAETLRIEGNKIVEIGKKPDSYNDINGQYIGLIKISKNAIKKVIDTYTSLNKEAMYDGKDFDNMYMTSFIQMIIDSVMNVHPVYINGGWLEIDSVDDLRCYEEADIFANR